MNDFILLFHRDMKTKELQPTPEQFQAAAKPWQDWVGGVAAQKKLVATGPRMAPEGKVVKPNNVVTDGPFAEIKESLAGYMIVKAKDFDEAIAIARGCPILQWGGNVEVRPVMTDDNK